jgi:hypothetical protein
VKPVLAPEARRRALIPAGWIPFGEAIAWIGFASAVPVDEWDAELIIGLTLWPWDPPSKVHQRLNDIAQHARLGTYGAHREEFPRSHWSFLKLGLEEAIGRAPFE